MRIRSSAFDHQGEIPAKYTSDGEDVAPPLAWSDVPPGAKRLALIVDDPDAPDPAAPKRTWVHWVLYDIPATATGIAEGGVLPDGAREGKNDWNSPGYGGPAPPIGRHRYFFKLFALDAPLGDLHKPTRAGLEQAMHGHIIATAELIGTYRKPGR